MGTSFLDATGRCFLRDPSGVGRTKYLLQAERHGKGGSFNGKIWLSPETHCRPGGVDPGWYPVVRTGVLLRYHSTGVEIYRTCGQTDRSFDGSYSPVMVL